MAAVKVLEICSSGELFNRVRAVSKCVCTCRQGDVLFGGAEGVIIPLWACGHSWQGNSLYYSY